MLRDRAQLYLCTDARKVSGDYAAFLDAAFEGGVDIIQLRDKTVEAAEELELLQVLRSSAERHDKLWAVNDRADIATLAQAPVFHIGQKDLPLALARRLVGEKTMVGLSTHTPEQVNKAVTDLSLDYFCVGPVWETPTKPGRAAVGPELVSYAANQVRVEKSVVPWFAIGGIHLGNIEQVVTAGASRVVVVRAITEAKDPSEAAKELRAYLPSLD
ncbi:thiamine phosphate synthase [Cryobacterium sp. CG_9.6]|uniref:thiamine phosphate synthase n=1 Tax=Cryobacterium sp. CG_9.6 TaxID=2760710 RepID=UPI002473F98A|nr:thiamine phosphate synthase [Cryobacterium sp. CG_9.6]MDH6238516.1 thiamine-phosphate pyrophosphorylase [Cryobacterium sp. CG_9.6]